MPCVSKFSFYVFFEISLFQPLAQTYLIIYPLFFKPFD